MLASTLVPILLASAFVHGVFGFGFPLVTTPLLALVFPFPTAILMTLLPALAVIATTLVGEGHVRAALRQYWSIPVSTVIGSFVGTQFLLNVDPEPFRAVLALLLVAYLITDHLRKEAHEPKFPLWTLPVVGFSLGLLGGVANVFAPLLAVYALYTRMSPLLMVATFNITFLFSKSGQVFGYISNGAFDMDVVLTTLWVIPFCMVALWLGTRVRRRFSVDQYRSVLKAFLWVISVVLVLDWLIGGLILPR